MADTDAPRDLYQRWIHELWSGDPAHVADLAAELVHDRFVGHWPDRDVEGPQRLAEVVAETHAAFDQLSFVVTVGPVVDGDYVAGRWAGEGENADGPATFFGNDILRVEQGKVVEYWTASVQAPHPSGHAAIDSAAALTGDADADDHTAETDRGPADGEGDGGEPGASDGSGQRSDS